MEVTTKGMRVLKKLYKYDNSTYDRFRNVSIYREETLSEKEQNSLREIGWKSNEIEFFKNHDDAVGKLLQLREEKGLTKKRCLDAFVAGVGGSYPRGRSVLSAWHKLHNLKQHTYQEQTEYACCSICSGSDKELYVNDSMFQYCLYVGNAYTSNAYYAYLNLKHLATQKPVKPTEEDKQKLKQLLYLLRNAPKDETPGQFEKRLTESKVLSGDRYTKRGLLDSLAIVGVIPNQFIQLTPDTWTDFFAIAIHEQSLKNTKGRSDVEMPWAGWIGKLKIDEEITDQLFHAYLCEITTNSVDF